MESMVYYDISVFFFFFQAEDGIRDLIVTGVQTCALPICLEIVQRSGIDAGLHHGGELARPLDLPALGPGAVGVVLVPVPGFRQGEALRGQIGRASCREKSVDLGGRRIIIKKKETKLSMAM